jgi:hypothetical protein
MGEGMGEGGGRGEATWTITAAAGSSSRICDAAPAAVSARLGLWRRVHCTRLWRRRSRRRQHCASPRSHGQAARAASPVPHGTTGCGPRRRRQRGSSVSGGSRAAARHLAAAEMSAGDELHQPVELQHLSRKRTSNTRPCAHAAPVPVLPPGMGEAPPAPHHRERPGHRDQPGEARGRRQAPGQQP